MNKCTMFHMKEKVCGCGHMFYQRQEPFLVTLDIIFDTK